MFPFLPVSPCKKNEGDRIWSPFLLHLGYFETDFFAGRLEDLEVGFDLFTYDAIGP